MHLYDSILPTTGWKHLIPVNVASLFHVASCVWKLWGGVR